MGIFDIDENIENVKPSREAKFIPLIKQLKEGSQMTGETIIDGFKFKYKYSEDPYAKHDANGSEWDITVYKHNGKKWVPMNIDSRFNRGRYIANEAPFELVYKLISFAIGSRRWHRWREENNPNRQIWIDLFEMTEDEVIVYDYFGFTPIIEDWHIRIAKNHNLQ